jgi:predicted RNA-binding Zn-ribbon protein involved in translation (DUF1610 family)
VIEMPLEDVNIKKKYDNVKCPKCGKKMTYWPEITIIPEYFECDECILMFGFDATITISNLKEI